MCAAGYAFCNEEARNRTPACSCRGWVHHHCTRAETRPLVRVHVGALHSAFALVLVLVRSRIGCQGTLTVLLPQSRPRVLSPTNGNQGWRIAIVPPGVTPLVTTLTDVRWIHVDVRYPDMGAEC